MKINHNIQKLSEIFPQVITEEYDENQKLVRSVNFEMLKEILGAQSSLDENYGFTWAGKKNAIKAAYEPTKKLMYEREIDGWHQENTKNMYIEGDNLDALKLLLTTHREVVDVIYIDPPYNTGRELVYSDNFSSFHSEWCSMIYPRLLLSRELLSPDGVIFVSIDDNELDNLKKMLDEIYGEKQFIARFIWLKTSTPPSLSKKVRKSAEYVLCYEKKRTSKKFFGEPLDNCDAPLLNTSNSEKMLTFPVGTINFAYDCGILIKKGVYKKLESLDDIQISNRLNNNPVRLLGHFKWSQQKLESEIENGTRFIIRSAIMSIRFQRHNNDGFRPPTNILLDKESGVSTNESAEKELQALEMQGVFDFPKPVSLIKKLLYMHTYDKKDSVVLDFFSGSSTTAHACFELNAEDNGHRSFIMIQEDTACLNNTGYQNICEIGKERIRRASNLISCKVKNTESPDTGFRVFYLG